MLSTGPLNAGRRRVFGSVFSPASLDARPPIASFDHDQTPTTSFQSTSTLQNDSFAPAYQTLDTSSDRQATEQAWAAATAFLCVPDRGFAPIYESRETDGSEALKEWNRLTPPSKETSEALAYLTAAAQHASSGQRDLFDWYGAEMRRHFLTNLRAGLSKV